MKWNFMFIVLLAVTILNGQTSNSGITIDGDVDRSDILQNSIKVVVDNKKNYHILTKNETINITNIKHENPKLYQEFKRLFQSGLYDLKTLNYKRTKALKEILVDLTHLQESQQGLQKGMNTILEFIHEPEIQKARKYMTNHCQRSQIKYIDQTVIELEALNAYRQSEIDKVKCMGEIYQVYDRKDFKIHLATNDSDIVSKIAYLANISRSDLLSNSVGEQSKYIKLSLIYIKH